jgi:hypothetical protein
MKQSQARWVYNAMMKDTRGISSWWPKSSVMLRPHNVALWLKISGLHLP